MRHVQLRSLQCIKRTGHNPSQSTHAFHERRGTDGAVADIFTTMNVTDRECFLLEDSHPGETFRDRISLLIQCTVHVFNATHVLPILSRSTPLIVSLKRMALRLSRPGQVKQEAHFPYQTRNGFDRKPLYENMMEHTRSKRWKPQYVLPGRVCKGVQTASPRQGRY